MVHPCPRPTALAIIFFGRTANSCESPIRPLGRRNPAGAVAGSRPLLAREGHPCGLYFPREWKTKHACLADLRIVVKQYLLTGRSLGSLSRRIFYAGLGGPCASG